MCNPYVVKSLLRIRSLIVNYRGIIYGSSVATCNLILIYQHEYCWHYSSV